MDDGACGGWVLVGFPVELGGDMLKWAGSTLGLSEDFCGQNASNGFTIIYSEAVVLYLSIKGINFSLSVPS